MKPVAKKPTVARKSGLSGYAPFLGAVKNRIRAAQVKAALAANAELIHLYWDIGRAIAAMQKKEGWGAGVIPRLARDIANEMPEVKGFSERNIKLMTQFAAEYPGLFTIGQPPVAQLAAVLLTDTKGQPLVRTTKGKAMPRKNVKPVHRVTGNLNLVELTKAGSALTLQEGGARG